MPRKAVGRAAVELPWLCPNTDSLIALADAPATVLGLSAADPALSVSPAIRPTRPEPDAYGFAAVLPGGDSAGHRRGIPRGHTRGRASDRIVHLTRIHLVAERAARSPRVSLMPPDSSRRDRGVGRRLAPLGWYASRLSSRMKRATRSRILVFPIAPRKSRPRSGDWITRPSRDVSPGDGGFRLGSQPRSVA